MSEEAGGFQNGSSNVSSSIPVLGLAEVSCIFNVPNPIAFLCFCFLARLGGNLLLSIPEVNLSLESLHYLKFPDIVKFLEEKKGNLLNKRVGLDSSFCCTIRVSYVLIPVRV
jgi:hypothetical protein